MEKLLHEIEEYLSGELTLDRLKSLVAGIVEPADSPVVELASQVYSGITFVEERAMTVENLDIELRETVERLRSRAA